MIRSITFMGLSDMRKMTPRRDAVVISMLDVDERLNHRGPRLGGYRSVLSLSLEDTSEETKCAEPGTWPHEPSEEEHQRFCQSAGNKVPTLTDALNIARFVNLHHQSEESLDLVVHCHAGVSRSAAVAKWASQFTEIPLGEKSQARTQRASPRLTRLLECAQFELEHKPRIVQPR